MEELLYVLTKEFASCVHIRFYFFTATHFHLAGHYHFGEFVCGYRGLKGWTQSQSNLCLIATNNNGMMNSSRATIFKNTNTCTCNCKNISIKLNFQPTRGCILHFIWSYMYWYNVWWGCTVWPLKSQCINFTPQYIAECYNLFFKSCLF